MKTASSSSYALAQYSQTGGVASMYAGGYRYNDNKWVIVTGVHFDSFMIRTSF